MIDFVSFAETGKSNLSMKITLVVALLFMHSICLAAPTFPNLTAVFDQENAVIKLKWQNKYPDATEYILQKSADNVVWYNLYTIGIADFSAGKIEKFNDKFPDQNKNYYRLKITQRNRTVQYSSSIVVIMGQPTSSWIIFPVPVTSVLNLQYTGSEPITSVISVFIQNSQGKILHRLRTSSLNRTIQIPVSNLGKGIYDVRIMIGDRNVWNQRFVK